MRISEALESSSWALSHLCVFNSDSNLISLSLSVFASLSLVNQSQKAAQTAGEMISRFYLYKKKKKTNDQEQ